MQLEDAVDVMRNPGDNDATEGLHAAATLLLTPEYLEQQTTAERLRLLESAVGLLCYRAATR